VISRFQKQPDLVFIKIGKFLPIETFALSDLFHIKDGQWIVAAAANGTSAFIVTFPLYHVF